MGGLCEEIWQKWRMRVRDGGSGDGSETGSVTKKEENKNRRPVAVHG